MESKDLIIIICAIIAGACIIAFAIAFVDDFMMMKTICHILTALLKI